MRHNSFPPTRSAGAALLFRGASLLVVTWLTACGGAAKPSLEEPSPPAEDSLDEHVERVRSTVESWEAGTGIALRVREGEGEPSQLLFAEATAPTYSDEIALWTIATVAAGADHTVLGHLMVGLAALEPGALEGDAERKDLVLALLLSSEPWSGQHPRAAWSINAGSHATMRLRENAAGDLEGEFEATLVSNDGEVTFTIERGYLYLKR